jgi:hypothetical protein
MGHYCDDNGDGIIDDCEVHACVVTAENDWRTANCPGYPHIHCDCPFWCPNAYDCEDIKNATAWFMEEADMNNDGMISSFDSLDSE